MTEYTATEVAYKNGYASGVTATKDALRTGIDKMLSDDTEVIISGGEVFVPINAVRKIISKLKVK